MALRPWCIFSFLGLFLLSPLHAETRSLVSHSDAENRALLINSANGLPGLDLDIKNIEAVTNHPSCAFKSQVLTDKAATIAAVQTSLKEMATQVESDGTLLFYFTG